MDDVTFDKVIDLLSDEAADKIFNALLDGDKERAAKEYWNYIEDVSKIAA